MFRIRDPGSGKKLFRNPDPEVKKAPDPGSWIRISNTVLKELSDGLCPAGTHVDIYETDNEGFLMPKLLYFEEVVL